MASPTAARKALTAQKPSEPKETTKKSPDGFLEVDATDLSGRHFTGRFKYRVPTLGQLVEIGKVKAVLTNGLGLINVDVSAASLIEMMAYLEVTIDHGAEGTPSWWAESDHGSRLYDVTPLRRLYEEARSFEDSFHGVRPSTRRTEAGAHEAADDRGHDPDGEAPVGEDVQGESPRREVLAGDGARGDGTDSRSNRSGRGNR